MCGGTGRVTKTVYDQPVALLWRPWTLRRCGICGRSKLWIGPENAESIRFRLCLTCDQPEGMWPE